MFRSLLRSSSPEVLSTFSWDALIAELQLHASTLLQVLKGSIEVKRYVRGKGRVVHSQGKNRRKRFLPKVEANSRPTSTAIIGTCAAILLRNKNVHMNLLQKIVSIIINSGHASKQEWLPTLMACIFPPLNLSLHSSQKFNRLVLDFRRCFCISHQRTLTRLDALGRNHDATVHG